MSQYHDCGQDDHDRGIIRIMLVTTLIAPGRIAREVLGLLMSTPGQELHTREIARRVKADAHPVQRALERLMGAGLLESRRLGNLRLWSVAEESALVPAVREVVRRTMGVAERLRQKLAKMSGVQLAFLFGSYASGRDKLGSDIDLFLVGSPDWRDLSKELAALTSELGREINPVVWSIDELGHPTRTQSRFISNLLREPRIWVVGDDHELERVCSSVGAKVVEARLVRRIRPDEAVARSRLQLAGVNLERARRERGGGDLDAALIFAEQALINAADAVLARDGYSANSTSCASVSGAPRRLRDRARLDRPDSVVTEHRPVRRERPGRRGPGRTSGGAGCPRRSGRGSAPGLSQNTPYEVRRPAARLASFVRPLI